MTLALTVKAKPDINSIQTSTRRCIEETIQNGERKKLVLATDSCGGSNGISPLRQRNSSCFNVDATSHGQQDSSDENKMP